MLLQQLLLAEMTSGRLTEADWLELGVTFRVVDEELTGPVIEHLRTSFLPDEPLSRSVSRRKGRINTCSHGSLGFSSGQNWAIIWNCIYEWKQLGCKEALSGS